MKKYKKQEQEKYWTPQKEYKNISLLEFENEELVKCLKIISKE